jgi:hypothetical protein
VQVFDFVVNLRLQFGKFSESQNIWFQIFQTQRTRDFHERIRAGWRFALVNELFGSLLYGKFK